MNKPIKFHASNLLFIVMGLLVFSLTACSSASASTPTVPTILNGPAQIPTIDQLKQAINDLYTRHPDINSFAVQAVTYNPTTRDKVLKICSEGGLVDSPKELEAQKVMACAPLIFFFYNYGQQKSVPESIDLARQLYWYALADKSDDVKQVLTKLLRDWKIQ